MAFSFPSFGGFGAPAPAPAAAPAQPFGAGFGAGFGAPAAAAAPAKPVPIAVNKFATLGQLTATADAAAPPTAGKALREAIDDVNAQLQRQRMLMVELDAKISPKVDLFKKLEDAMKDSQQKVVTLRNRQTELNSDDVAKLRQDVQWSAKHVEATYSRASIISAGAGGTSHVDLPAPLLAEFYQAASKRQSNLLQLLADTEAVVDSLGPLNGPSGYPGDRSAEVEQLQEVIRLLLAGIVKIAASNVEPMQTECDHLRATLLRQKGLQAGGASSAAAAVDPFRASDLADEQRRTEAAKAREARVQAEFDVKRLMKERAKAATAAAAAPAAGTTGGFGVLPATGAAPAPAAGASLFSFAAPAAPAPAPAGFGFGAAPAPAPGAAGFSFAAPAPAPAPQASPFGGFSGFGQAPAPAPAAAGGFGGFGPAAATTAPPKLSLPGFGAPAPAPAPGAFGGFGAPATGGFGSLGLGQPAAAAPAWGATPTGAPSAPKSKSKGKR